MPNKISLYRMAYAIFPMLLNLAICWVWLQLFYIGIPVREIIDRFRKKNSGTGTGADRRDGKSSCNDVDDHVREVLLKQYTDLGSMNFHEIGVLSLFVILVMLWFFREPQFMPGWGELFHTT